VPRVLSGVRKVLEMMDWASNEGEDHEGVLGVQGDDLATDPADALVRFGAVGASEVAPDDDVLLVLAPQNMVGASIYEPLKAMAEAAVAQNSAIILINPLLADRLSSSGVMGVRGRSDRMQFAASFAEVYHMRCLYSGTTFMYPIRGALRMSHAAQPVGTPPLYVLYERQESADGKAEEYVPVGAFEEEPSTDLITGLVSRQNL